jgi:hypothetical protein
MERVQRSLVTCPWHALTASWKARMLQGYRLACAQCGSRLSKNDTQ